MLAAGFWDIGAGLGVSASAAVEQGSVVAAPGTSALTSKSDAALPLAVSIAIVFFTYWCVDIVSPALPTIQKTLALSATGAGLVFSVFFAGRLISNLPAAWLVERVGLIASRRPLSAMS